MSYETRRKKRAMRRAQKKTQGADRRIIEFLRDSRKASRGRTRGGDDR